MNRTLLLCVMAICASGCAAHNYTYFLVDPTPARHPALKEEGTLARPFGFGSTSVIRLPSFHRTFIAVVEPKPNGRVSVPSSLSAGCFAGAGSTR